MKQVYIIRHGETDNNKNHKLQGRGVNASINKTGRIQGEEIAFALKEVPIQKVVVSSLIRTLETAQPLIDQKDAVVESYAELDEMSFGKWEGEHFNDVKKDIHALNTRWMSGDITAEVEDGESPQQVFDRAGSKVVEILNHSEEEYIAFVIHGRLIRIILSEFLGKGLKNMHLIKHQNGAINHLTWNGDGFEVVILNKVDHLSTEAVDWS
ncbi:MAG: histidine phosphatase family protein [Balneolaceae bacterium]